MFCRHLFGNISGRFCGISRFLGISQDFAEIPEFRGSGTARNIRSPAYRKYRKQCILWLGTYTDVMRCIHYMCCGSIIYPWFKFYFTLFEIYYNTFSYPKAKEYKIKTKDKIEPQHDQYCTSIISIIFFRCFFS